MEHPTGLKWVSFLLILMFLGAGIASAEMDLGLEGVGIRGGVSVDPDQIILGGHLNLGQFMNDLYFMPNLTLGLGDDLTIVAVSPDVAYAFPVPDIGALYVGGLFTLQWIKSDIEEHSGVDADDTDMEVGIHVIGGLILDSFPMFFEANVGIDDAPDLKAVVGYTFPIR